MSEVRVLLLFVLFISSLLVFVWLYLFGIRSTAYLSPNTKFTTFGTSVSDTGSGAGYTESITSR